MLRGVTLLSKAFLHHLSGLLSLRSFHLLWRAAKMQPRRSRYAAREGRRLLTTPHHPSLPRLRALELLEQFLRAPQSELLAEAVPETLKNMLLVMGARHLRDCSSPRRALPPTARYANLAPPACVNACR